MFAGGQFMFGHVSQQLELRRPVPSRFFWPRVTVQNAGLLATLGFGQAGVLFKSVLNVGRRKGAGRHIRFRSTSLCAAKYPNEMYIQLFYVPLKQNNNQKALQ